MLSKNELLGKEKSEAQARFTGYVELMSETIERKFPNGLEFDKLPFVSRFLYHGDIAVNYYTGLDKELIKAIERSDVFRKMANELSDNGYEYEFSSWVRFNNARAEWTIELIIR